MKEPGAIIGSFINPRPILDLADGEAPIAVGNLPSLSGCANMLHARRLMLPGIFGPLNKSSVPDFPPFDAAQIFNRQSNRR